MTSYGICIFPVRVMPRILPARNAGILTTPKGIKEDRLEISGEFLAYLNHLSSVFGPFYQVTPFLRPYAALARLDMMMMMMNAVLDKGRFSDPPRATRIPLSVPCLTTLCVYKISLPIT